ncbi:MAG TPA: DUF502 domain-containing protein [Thermoanaerobaculia bacterium]|jgi:uncharacterized membrane protein|nr:DUF502 domain-containing protein [Thermoanaerobaculia bacterium]
MNWLIKNFLRGLVIVVPIALTLYLLYEAFVRIDRLLNLPTPGAGFAITIVTIIAIGAVASNFFVRKFLRVTEVIFTRAPLVRLVYASIKDLLEAFVGDKKRFDQPVALTITDGVRTLGFITQDDLGFLSLPGQIAVYLPFSYSMAGTLVVVGRERVEALAVDSANVMALIISGGVSRGAAETRR